MRISDWSSDVCSSDLHVHYPRRAPAAARDPQRIHGGIVRQFHQGVGPRLVASREMSLFQKALGVKADPYPPIRPDAAGESLHALRNIGGDRTPACRNTDVRSEEHTSELQSLMRISYAVFCLKKKNYTTQPYNTTCTIRPSNA